MGIFDDMWDVIAPYLEERLMSLVPNPMFETQMILVEASKDVANGASWAEATSDAIQMRLGQKLATAAVSGIALGTVNYIISAVNAGSGLAYSTAGGGSYGVTSVAKGAMSVPYWKQLLMSAGLSVAWYGTMVFTYHSLNSQYEKATDWEKVQFENTMLDLGENTRAYLKSMGFSDEDIDVIYAFRNKFLNMGAVSGSSEDVVVEVEGDTSNWNDGAQKTAEELKFAFMAKDWDTVTKKFQTLVSYGNMTFEEMKASWVDSLALESGLSESQVRGAYIGYSDFGTDLQRCMNYKSSLSRSGTYGNVTPSVPSVVPDVEYVPDYSVIPDVDEPEPVPDYSVIPDVAEPEVVYVPEPYEIEKIVEVVREVPVETVREVIKEVPVEVLREVIKYVEVPKVVEVEKVIQSKPVYTQHRSDIYYHYPEEQPEPVTALDLLKDEYEYLKYQKLIDDFYAEEEEDIVNPFEVEDLVDQILNDKFGQWVDPEEDMVTLAEFYRGKKFGVSVLDELF